jgi:hypothetical protein
MSNGSSSSSAIGWPSTVVAIAIVAAVSAISIAAINHYGSVDDALKFWSALSGLVGIVTGAMVTYFFARGSVQAAQSATQTAQSAASSATSAKDVQAERALVATQGLAAALSEMDPEQAAALRSHPAVSMALTPPG